MKFRVTRSSAICSLRCLALLLGPIACGSDPQAIDSTSQGGSLNLTNTGGTNSTADSAGAAGDSVAGSDVLGQAGAAGMDSSDGGSGGDANETPCIGRPELPAQPNIVIFIADDHSQSDLEPYGNQWVDTPTMQELADNGARFNRAYVGSPSCAPSRAILLTGLTSVHNGAQANHTQPKPELKKLPAYLRPLGYTVAAFGKVGHGAATDYGFDVEDPNVLGAVDYIETYDSEDRLLLFAGSHDPHVPWPDNRYPNAEVELPDTSIDDANGITRRRRRFYYTDINNVDRELRQVYDAAQAKFGDDLLFLYTADHGSQWPFAKWNLYEAGVRVPLLAVWPNVLEPGSQSDAMLSWMDLLPTLIELAGGSVPVDLDGKSFVPLLRCQTAGHHEELFVEHTGDLEAYPMRAIVTPTHKYIKNLHPEFKFSTHLDQNTQLPHNLYWPEWEADPRPESQAIVQRYYERPADELYDLRVDPSEKHNLADDPSQAALLEDLRGRVEDWMAAQGDMGLVHKEPILLE